jgi:GH35 family endo-1,4-beta-xylanase
MRVTVEEQGSPYQGAAVDTVHVTPVWQQFSISGTTSGFGPNGLTVHFQLGAQAGSMEIAAVNVRDMGPEVVPAVVQDALQPEQVAARIEKYRKGMLTIKVVDASGHPLSGATVKITQTRHAFLFGANFFGLNPSDTSLLQLAYQKDFIDLLNYATLPFYWGSFEPQQGYPRYTQLEAMANWCRAHGLTLKGHPLIYQQAWPIWAPNDADTAVPLLKARVFDIISHFKDQIHFWDILNEANGAADFSPANGESKWVKRDGPVQVVGTALDWARQAQAGSGNPAETFLYNDYETGRANVDLLTKLQSAGKLPDVIGIQSHMHSGPWSLAHVWEVCQTFSRFGRPIHFTETTVLSGPKRLHQPNDSVAIDWNTTPHDEAPQAEYVTQFYRLLFSHPAVRAITWWDLSDHNAWMGAPAGLVRKDMSPKPGYTRLMDLIHHQWWTRVEGRTDDQGTLTHRVFYGDYKIVVTTDSGQVQTRTVTFPESAPPMTVTVPLP